MDERPAKAHRAPQSGRSAEKKSKSKGEDGKPKGQGFNEKASLKQISWRALPARAFAPKSGRNANAAGRRTAEKDQTRLHVPLVNRTPDEEPPPIVVAIVGPPGVGKSTLLKSLVKRFTKHTLNEVRGPVTVVSGKQRRITFIECTNDLNAMIDIAKVADLILLMIDGSFGFEMETFEFLNVLQAHGFPKVIGVLTHLDLIKKTATLRNQKKTLKNRFWKEIYAGAKLFYLSGVLNGRYPDTEIQNLSRFISVMKFRPLIFRNSHPYLLADRIQDLTAPQTIAANPKIDRTITLYGYLRGTNLPAINARVHIPGAGDLRISGVEKLKDPCPLPTKDGEKRRKMGEKQKLIHAPMSDVGGVMFDKDAVYVNVMGSFTRRNDDEEFDENGKRNVFQGAGEKMVMDLQEVPKTLAENIASSSIRLLGSSTAPLQVARQRRRATGGIGDLVGSDEDQDEDNDSEEDEDDDDEDEGSDDGFHGAGLADDDDEAGDEELQFDGDDSEDDDEEDEDAPMLNLEDEEYDQEIDEEEEEEAGLSIAERIYTAGPSSTSAWPRVHNSAVEEDDEDFFTVKSGSRAEDKEVIDQVKEDFDFEQLKIWDDEVLLDSLRHHFITGEDDGEGEGAGENQYEEEGGDFEDLEAGDDENGDEGGTSTSVFPEEEDLDHEAERAKALASKKEALKRRFNEEYDDDDEEKVDFYTEKKDEMARQQQLNREEFADVDEETRHLVEGFRPGTYVRLELAGVPCELIDNFDPTFPIIVGGLLPTEERFGFLTARIKRHRWHHKILKTNDPLVFSLGWRRFQSLPIYHLDDHSIRNRLLKYTPEHMHCFATFYAPVSLPNTGFCAFNTLGSSVPGFRISATGVILDVDRSTKIVKKIKLTGVPTKIFKNTAFIRDMFNSALEVAKFEGASIKTVSGIRGQIKKALTKPEGSFRATFEDKVLMSDIVFLRAWYSVEPKKFYNPVMSLLLQDKKSWRGMRLTGTVRYEEGLKTPLQASSTYKPVERTTRRFNTLKVPRALQASLPYATKFKAMKPQKKPTYMQKRAVVLDPTEKKAAALLSQIQALRKDKVSRRKTKQDEKKAEHKKKVEETDERRAGKIKEDRKQKLRLESVKSKRAERDEGGGGRGGKKRKTG